MVEVPLPSRSIPHSLDVLEEVMGAPANDGSTESPTTVEAEHRYRNWTRISSV